MDTNSLITLWNLTQRHPGTGGARAAAGVLLGLYNGRRFSMNLTDLRILDRNYLDAAMAVIGADAGRPQMEVHDWLNRLTGRHDFGERFEHLAHEYHMKGRCRRDELYPIDPKRIVITTQEAAA